LALEIDKVDTESAVWVFAKGFEDMKTNPKTFLKVYLYFNKYQHCMGDVLKRSIEEGINIYIKEKEGKYGINLEQQKDIINEGIKFLNDPTNSSEEKKIIVQFLWDLWSGFFSKVEEIKNRDEIYEKMNQQSLSIIEMLNTVRKDTKLSEEVDKVLLNFQIHYSRNDLSVEFLQSPLISTIRKKITQSMSLF